MNSHKDPLDEVWAIKEQLWREVEHLPIKEAVRESLRRANETAKRLGLDKNMVQPPVRTRLNSAGAHGPSNK